MATRRDQAKLEELHPQMLKHFLELDEECFTTHGFRLRVVSGYRDPKEQMENYLKGRKEVKDEATATITYVVVDEDAVVTDAKPGQSFHEKRRAVDAYPEFEGRTLSDKDKNEDAWHKAGALAGKHGLVWGGSFKIGPAGSPDEPHFEDEYCVTHSKFHPQAAAFDSDGNCTQT